MYISADIIHEKQKALNAHRAALTGLSSSLPPVLKQLNYGRGSNDLLSAVRDFHNLDWYRRRQIGWGAESIDHWREYQDLVHCEDAIRETLARRLSRLSRHARGKGKLEVAHWVSSLQNSVTHLAEMEDELYAARRAWGRLITATTKKALPLGAGNQIFDLAHSGMQSSPAVFAIQDPCNSYPACDALEIGAQVGHNAALAEYYRAGNCGEQADFAAAEANRLLPESTITRLAYGGTVHTYLVLGPPNFPESAIIDPWPMKGTVSRESNYGLKIGLTTSVIYSFIADGRDLLGLGRRLIRPTTGRPSKKAGISIPEATKYLQSKAPAQAAVTYFITSTGGYNSDSDSDDEPQCGYSLSATSLTATAEYGFLPLGESYRPPLAAAVECAQSRPAGHAATRTQDYRPYASLHPVASAALPKPPRLIEPLIASEVTRTSRLRRTGRC